MPHRELGHAVAQLVEALRNKSEGRGFDSRCVSLESFIDNPSGCTITPGVVLPGDKAGRCVGLTTLPPSCADCLEVWEIQPSGTLRASPGL